MICSVDYVRLGRGAAAIGCLPTQGKRAPPVERCQTFWKKLSRISIWNAPSNRFYCPDNQFVTKTNRQQRCPKIGPDGPMPGFSLATLPGGPPFLLPAILFC
jgi:hypothetical protein